MGSKLGLILSLGIIFIALLFGADLFMIQINYTDLDAMSTYVSYKISKEREVSEYLKDTLPSFTIMVLCLIGRKYLSYKLSTRWVNVGGHIMFNMDMPMYLHNIQNKLIPKLMEKGIILNNRYSHISPGEVSFETKNTEPRLRFRFYNARIEIINEKNYSYPMFTCVSTASLADKFIDKDTLGVIGEIDLMTEEHVDEAVRLIINKINEVYEKGYINKIITDEEN